MKKSVTMDVQIGWVREQLKSTKGGEKMILSAILKELKAVRRIRMDLWGRPDREA